MSTDVVLFHSSEVDDPALLAEGWYIGFVRCGVLTTDDARGPYPTEDAAGLAMAAGAWMP